MDWRTVIIWLFCVSFTAPDKIPEISDLLGGYLPPSNSFGDSGNRDIFQGLGFQLPSSSYDSPEDQSSFDGSEDDTDDSGELLPSLNYQTPTVDSSGSDKFFSGSVIPAQKINSFLKPSQSYVVPSIHEEQSNKFSDQQAPICILANPGNSVTPQKTTSGFIQKLHSNVQPHNGGFNSPSRANKLPTNLPKFPPSNQNYVAPDESDEDINKGIFINHKVKSDDLDNSFESSSQNSYKAPAFFSNTIRTTSNKKNIQNLGQRYDHPRQAYAAPDKSEEESDQKPIFRQPEVKQKSNDGAFESPNPQQVYEHPSKYTAPNTVNRDSSDSDTDRGTFGSKGNSILNRKFRPIPVRPSQRYNSPDSTTSSRESNENNFGASLFFKLPKTPSRSNSFTSSFQKTPTNSGSSDETAINSIAPTISQPVANKISGSSIHKRPSNLIQRPLRTYSHPLNNQRISIPSSNVSPKSNIIKQNTIFSSLQATPSSHFNTNDDDSDESYNEPEQFYKTPNSSGQIFKHKATSPVINNFKSIPSIAFNKVKSAAKPANRNINQPSTFSEKKSNIRENVSLGAFSPGLKKINAPKVNFGNRYKAPQIHASHAQINENDDSKERSTNNVVTSSYTPPNHHNLLKSPSQNIRDDSDENYKVPSRFSTNIQNSDENEDTAFFNQPIRSSIVKQRPFSSGQRGRGHGKGYEKTRVDESRDILIPVKNEDTVFVNQPIRNKIIKQGPFPSVQIGRGHEKGYENTRVDESREILSPVKISQTKTNPYAYTAPANNQVPNTFSSSSDQKSDEYEGADENEGIRRGSLLLSEPQYVAPSPSNVIKNVDTKPKDATKKKMMMMPYDFRWEVNDGESGNDFGQTAVSDGMVEKGKYHVLLPDGRRQVVTYLADWETGYHVDVTYEGEATDGSVIAKDTYNSN